MVRKSVKNSKIHIWWSTFHPKLSEIKNHYRKSSIFCSAHYFCAMDNDDCAMTMVKIPKPPISLTPGHTLISNTPLLPPALSSPQYTATLALLIPFLQPSSLGLVARPHLWSYRLEYRQKEYFSNLLETGLLHQIFVF